MGSCLPFPELPALRPLEKEQSKKTGPLLSQVLRTKGTLCGAGTVPPPHWTAAHLSCNSVSHPAGPASPLISCFPFRLPALTPLACSPSSTQGAGTGEGSRNVWGKQRGGRESSLHAQDLAQAPVPVHCFPVTLCPHQLFQFSPQARAGWMSPPQTHSTHWSLMCRQLTCLG